jgi:hypothetical protein
LYKFFAKVWYGLLEQQRHLNSCSNFKICSNVWFRYLGQQGQLNSYPSKTFSKVLVLITPAAVPAKQLLLQKFLQSFGMDYYCSSAS